MTDYLFTIDLSKDITKPDWQVTGDGKSYPIKTMPPRLNQGDTISIEFTGREIVEGRMFLHVRPIRNSSNKTSPFSHASTPGTENWTHELNKKRQLVIDETNGYWAFAIIGLFKSNLIIDGKAVEIPCFVDPEVQVGTGVSPQH